MSPLFATAPAPSRPIRRSELLFGWHARGLSLDAYTGQVGTFSAAVEGVPGSITGRNGVTITGMRGLPRFTQIPGLGSGYGVSPAQSIVTRLEVVGDEPGQDADQLVYPWPLKVMAFSLYLRLWPAYTPGSDVGSDDKYALRIGFGTSDGGRIGIRRVGTSWQARRARVAVALDSAFVESALTAYPIDLLTTLSPGGTLQLLSRDATGFLQQGASVTDANMMIPTESWGSETLFLAAGGSAGRWWLETVKIARGVQTLASMDLLS